MSVEPRIVSRFLALTERFEGRVPWLYLDVKCLVTVGLGMLCDSVESTSRFDWIHRDGSPARPDEVALSWKVVKAARMLAPLGGGVFARLTDIRATDASIDRVFAAGVEEFSDRLRKTFPDLDSWPDDAQFAMLSMAWAMGPAFAEGHAWPAFTQACHAHDWETAADECKMDEIGQNASFKARNVENARLFRSAAQPVDVTDGGQNRPVYVSPDPEPS